MLLAGLAVALLLAPAVLPLEATAAGIGAAPASLEATAAPLRAGYPWSGSPARAAAVTYRISITAAVDGQTATGSAVQAVTVEADADDFAADLPQPQGSVRVQGEAVVIAVPGHPTLILPMFWGNEQLYGLYVPGGCELGGHGTDLRQLVAAVARFRGTCTVNPAHSLPVLSIADPADPATIAAARDVVIERIEVSTTEEPVTTGIASRFPWLDSAGADTAVIYRDPVARARFYRRSFVREVPL